MRVRKGNASQQRGFTLIAALVSTSIAALAGSALLLGVSTSLKATNDVEEQTIASGIALQLVDEIVGKVGAGPYETSLGRSAYEQAGVCRERYNDLDDFNGYTCQPPKDFWGDVLGQGGGQGGLRHQNFQVATNYFDRWREQVEVYYVSDADQSVRLQAGQSSNHRAVEVRILVDNPQGGAREVGHARRIVAYVPND